MIREAKTDEEILATYEVMHQLRPAIERGDYLPIVRRMMDGGYRLAASHDEAGIARGVAGFRCFEMLYAGPLLYVDDLVTDEQPQPAAFGRQVGLGQRVQPARAFGSRGHPPGIGQRLQVTADSRLRKLEHGAELRHGQLL